MAWALPNYYRQHHRLAVMPAGQCSKASSRKCICANPLANEARHAFVGCASGAMNGGGGEGCARGAVSQVLSKWVTLRTETWGPAGQFAAATIAGGTTSVITGGKFATGAQTAAFGYLFNACMSARDCWREAQEQIGKLAAGIGNAFKAVAWALTPGSSAVDCFSEGCSAAGAVVAAIDILPAGGKVASLTFKTAHYAGRLTGAGLDVAKVETAVAADLAKIPTDQITSGADISGRVLIDNTAVIYRAMPMPNGSITVGTIHPDDLRWMKK
jgi:hypothetical protein